MIHACVLMDNHYHLLTETPQANLVSGMHWLQGTYTNRYNAGTASMDTFSPEATGRC